MAHDDRDGGTYHIADGTHGHAVLQVPLRAGRPFRRALHRWHVGQPAGAVRSPQDPDQQQPQTRVHVAVHDCQRRRRAQRAARHVFRERVQAGHKGHRVDVPVPRPVAVHLGRVRMRGHFRHGLRTVAGPHQAVSISKGTCG